MASSLKDFKVEGPEWAHGCEGCEFGLVLPPPRIQALTLAEQRAAEFGEDMLLFCECRAGFMYRQYLRKIYNGMPMEARQRLREHIWAAHTPTVHSAATTTAPPATGGRG